jgi:hypothetical protein
MNFHWTKKTNPFFFIAISTIILFFFCGFIYYAVLAIKNPIRLNVRHDLPNVIEEDKKLGFRMKPFLNILYPVGNITQDFITDQHGNRAISPDTPMISTAEIISIGCSQTWGHGVPADKTYSYILGQLTQLPSLNLGVSSYGGVSSLRKLQLFSDLNPRYVIYGYWYDHDTRNLSSCAPSLFKNCLAVPHIVFKNNKPEIVDPKPGNNDRVESNYGQVRDLGAGRKNYSLLSDVWWLFKRDLANVVQNIGLSQVLEEGYHTNFSSEQKELGSKYLLRELAREVQKLGATLIVVYIPNYFDPKEIQPVPNYIRDELSMLRVTLIDMESDFAVAKKTFGDAYLKVPNDGHLSIAGHDLIAKAVSKEIKIREGLLHRGAVSD